MTEEQRVAIITGGGSGIGRAAAMAFAQRRHWVVVADVDEPGGNETVRVVTAAGGRAIFIATDVAQTADVARLVEQTLSHFGRLDMAVNNAGIEEDNTRPLDEQSEQQFDRHIAVNLKGIWLCMKYELPPILERGGAIVNVASVLGLRGGANFASYAASKHGVVGLSSSAALEYAGRGVRINTLCPGTTRTPMLARTIGGDPAKERRFTQGHPIGRIAEPEEVAAVALWLCSTEASYITGAVIRVDGGDLA